MDVARMNLSHGAYADHERIYEWVRTAADAAGRGVGILVDLQGPKIRLGTFADGPGRARRRAPSSSSRPTTSPATSTICSTTYKGLPGDVNVGDAILIDDGKVALEAIEVTDTTCVTRVVEGGRVSDNKGINLPGVAVSVPAMSEKDVADLRWALRLGVDMIALSFVRRADDLLDVAADHGRRGRAPPGARQDREAAGGRQPRVDHRRLRRHHGRARRPRRGAAARAGAAGAEARRHARAPSRQAGHRRHADARLDGVDDAPDARRGQRRRQRGPRRRRRAHALGRDLGRRPPRPRRAHDGRASSSRSRARRSTSCRRSSTATTRRRARSPAPPSTSASTSAPRPSSPSPRPAARPARGALPPQTCRCWRSRPTRACAASWRCAGASRPSSCPKTTSTDEMVRLVDAGLQEIDRVSVGQLIVIIAGVPPGVPGTTNGMRVHRMGTSIASGI